MEEACRLVPGLGKGRVDILRAFPARRPPVTLRCFASLQTWFILSPCSPAAACAQRTIRAMSISSWPSDALRSFAFSRLRSCVSPTSLPIDYEQTLVITGVAAEPCQLQQVVPEFASIANARLDFDAGEVAVH